MPINSQLAETLVTTAERQSIESQDFKKSKMEKSLMSEKMYENEAKKALRGQLNVPLPVMSGFVDALQSKIDEPIKINVSHQDEADLKKALKAQAAIGKESGEDRGQWDFIDQGQKKLAIYCGRGHYVFFSSRDNRGRFASSLEDVDYLDFECDPGGKNNLDNHIFCGRRNVYKSAHELEEGIKEGWYSAENVGHLITNRSEHEFRETQDQYNLRLVREETLKLHMSQHNYTGETIFSLNEWTMTFRGKRYYLLYDPISKIWVRAEELKEMFMSERYPFVSWGTHIDRNNYWNKAPADDIQPIHEWTRIAANEMLNNLRKRNWDMKALDPDFFPDPSQLEYKRPDQLVIATPPAGKQIAQGVYEFTTPDTTQVTISLIDFIRNYVGTQTGVTSATQGESEEDKVSIHFSNLQQISDRIGSTSKSYVRAHTGIGQRFIEGMKDNLTESYLVKMIGPSGYEWDELTRDDLNTKEDFSFVVKGGGAEARVDEIKNQKKADVIDKIVTNERLQQAYNPGWLARTLLEVAEFDEADIKTATNVEGSGDSVLMSEAKQAIDDIIAGKTPKMNRGANEAFMQKIVDFAIDNVPIDRQDDFNKLMGYAMAHKEIARKNARRRAAKEIQLQQQKALEQQPVQPAVPQRVPNEEINTLDTPPPEAQVPFRQDNDLNAG